MAVSDSLILFLSEPCEAGKHKECDRKWTGMGLEIICKCKCH